MGSTVEADDPDFLHIFDLSDGIHFDLASIHDLFEAIAVFEPQILLFDLVQILPELNGLLEHL